MISKEVFVSVLGGVESQYRKDVGYGDGLRDVFGFRDYVLYDNSDLVKSVLDLLRVYFPVDDDGFCEIEFWCYYQNFGKLGEEYESPEQFYDRLVSVN